MIDKEASENNGRLVWDSSKTGWYQVPPSTPFSRQFDKDQRDYAKNIKNQIRTGGDIDCDNAEVITYYSEQIKQEEKNKKAAERAKRMATGKATFWDKLTDFFG